jgi:hypothetical protein
MKKTAKREIILKGINASAGICIGKAYLVDRSGVDVIPATPSLKKTSRTKSNGSSPPSRPPNRPSEASSKTAPASFRKPPF